MKRSALICRTLLCGLVAGFAGCAHYEAAPLVPQDTHRELQTRTLDDSGLREFIAANAPELAKEWPRRSWDLSALTFAAFYFHPSLDVARANIAVAEAGIVTAQARPNPSLSFIPEYSGNAGTNSAWALGWNLDVPFETARKRGYRVAQASALSVSARLQLADAAWAVRSHLRAALLDLILTRRAIELAHAEISARADVVRRMEQRFEAGDVSRTEVDAARTQLVQARIGHQNILGRAHEAQANLAVALGVPSGGLENLTFDWPDLEKLPGAKDVSTASIQTEALLNRLDMRRAFADYAVIERALQLEYAKQYPDVRLLPHYTFDQGQHKFALGVGIELPLLNRNEGPIAEAKARREKSAADFLALQSRAIGELGKARVQYEAALAELAEAGGALTELQTRTEKLTRRAVELGEADRLALASVQLQGVVVARARFDALRRAQTGLGALEDAVQRPLAPTGPLPETPQAPRRAAKDSK